MTYSIKEIFYTLQGEGAHAGRPAVFCRFSGCNLWTGRESDRASAVCSFCDTDFVGTDGERGGKFADPAALAAVIDSLWPPSYPASKYVVFTGGEPLLQLDVPLIDAMHAAGFENAIETNGTLPVPAGVDWICVSPKMGARLLLEKGNEIKVVIPRPGKTWTSTPGSISSISSCGRWTVRWPNTIPVSPSRPASAIRNGN